MNNLFNRSELNRYARHLSLPEIGWEGQQRLRAARVLVVGAGGLGCPALQYLAAAGVGHIGIVDGDTVDESNLQRQVLYTTYDVGQSKAIVAKKRLEALNPYVEIMAYPVTLTAENALEILTSYDLVADGTDNFMARYLVNDACVLLNKVNVYASVSRFSGQVAVFNALNEDGSRTPNYRDLFPAPPAAGAVLSCAEEGVLGVLPGMIGAMQASEILKLITRFGEPLSGKLALFDAANFSLQIIQLQKTTHTKINTLIDYDAFCNNKNSTEVNTITAHQLNRLIQDGTAIQLVDVRQPQEHQQFNIGGISIPLKDIVHSIHLLSKEKLIVLYCQSGSRSVQAFHHLKEKGNDYQLFSLEGGISAYLKTK